MEQGTKSDLQGGARIAVGFAVVAALTYLAGCPIL